MKCGIMFANTVFPDGQRAAAFASAAEEAGFESLWTVEHVVFPDNYGSSYPYDQSGKMPAHPKSKLTDPIVWLTWVGAATRRMKLCTGIVILPQRNPVVFAKEVATLDHLTEGRVELGVGVGWLREEFDALGIPWENRGKRTDEYIAAMRTLWSGPSVEFHGDYVDFSGVSSYPQPANGTVPIIIGGHSRAAAERAGRLGDGFFPGKGNIVELADIVRQTATDCGRDPDAIEITFSVQGLMGDDPAGSVEELEAAGVNRTMLPALLFHRDFEESLPMWAEKLSITPE
ncbi:MAG: LLM class F420-dependent oxidoreductase [Acidimicrobiales bacterium]